MKLNISHSESYRMYNDPLEIVTVVWQSGTINRSVKKFAKVVDRSWFVNIKFIAIGYHQF